MKEEQYWTLKVENWNLTLIREDYNRWNCLVLTVAIITDVTAATIKITLELTSLTSTTS